MAAFESYSRYYNLFYKDKDYAGEAGYVSDLINKYSKGARKLLDLGCGTGKHAFLLAEMGFEVSGVDNSPEMLAVANAHLATLDSRQKACRFYQGDIRTIRLDQDFDVVISLFHVMSYQTGNEDLQAAFNTARYHLEPGGIFIFDCWYGPAVLTDRPEVRVKRLEDEEIAVTRIVEPFMHPNENRVDLHYQVLVKNKASGAVEELNEIHRMRYLFQPEIHMFLQAAEMRLVDAFAWKSMLPTGFDTWGACFVAQV